MSKSNLKPTPDIVLEILKTGNDRFVNGKSLHLNTDAERLELCGVENQRDHAYATVIACSDSRVPVERIFDAGVMDLFVIRVAGNVLAPETIGSIEYGIVHVHTPLLVILGHSQCGAVTAATNTFLGGNPPSEKHIGSLLERIRPAVERATKRFPGLAPDGLVPHATEENVWHSIEDLFRESPAIRELFRAGRVKVIGAHYEVSTGKVVWLPEERVDEIFGLFEE